MTKKIKTREEYINEYMEKKLKDCTLPYGIQWFNLYAETEEKAEKAYLRYLKRLENE